MGDLDEAQKLVDSLSTTGIPIVVDDEWMHKERVYSERLIGVWINPKTKEERETHNALIHYSKTGTHIVPSKDGEDES